MASAESVTDQTTMVAISIGLPKLSFTLILADSKLRIRKDTVLRIKNGMVQRRPLRFSVPT